MLLYECLQLKINKNAKMLTPNIRLFYIFGLCYLKVISEVCRIELQYQFTLQSNIQTSFASMYKVLDRIIDILLGVAWDSNI